MAKNLKIGSDTYPYPEEGENPGYAENATAWAEAVTDALTNVQGPNDILLTSASLTNGQSTFTDIPGLLFNTGEVQAVEISYFIIRVYDSGSSTLTESGKIYGNYDGSDFKIAIEADDNAGITIGVNNSGQFQYKSTNLTDHISTTVRFKASTIDQP